MIVAVTPLCTTVTTRSEMHEWVRPLRLMSTSFTCPLPAGMVIAVDAGVLAPLSGMDMATVLDPATLWAGAADAGAASAPAAVVASSATTAEAAVVRTREWVFVMPDQSLSEDVRVAGFPPVSSDLDRSLTPPRRNGANTPERVRTGAT